jgi:hypothetical protein
MQYIHRCDSRQTFSRDKIKSKQSINRLDYFLTRSCTSQRYHMRFDITFARTLSFLDGFISDLIEVRRIEQEEDYVD